MKALHLTPSLLSLVIASVLSTNTLAQASTDESVKKLNTVKITADAEEPPALINMEKPAGTSKLKVPVIEMPSSIAVVEEAFIRETGAKNIQDALLYSSGVYAGRYGFDTRGDWASVRGLNVSAYQDGLRSIYGFYNSARTEIYALERIEVLKGPSSVLYGQSELGGIVNTLSKRPKAEQQGEIWAQAGSYDRAQLAADVTGSIDEDSQWLYRLVALQRDSGTQVDYVNDDALLIAPSLTWRPTDGTEVTLLLNHQEIDSKVSSQFLPSKGTIDPAPLGRIDPSTFAGEPDWDRYDTDRDDVTLLVNQALSEQWNISLTARDSESLGETREIYTRVGAIPSDAGDMPRTVHIADRSTDIQSVDLRLEGDFKVGITRHRLAFGIDHQDALWEEWNYYFAVDTTPFNVYKPVYGQLSLDNLITTDRPDNSIEQTGFYLIDHVEIGKVVVSAALRRDDSDSTVLNVGTTPDYVRNDEETTRHIGVMYKFDNGISPYISYSDAFAPNLGTNTNSQGVALGLAPTTGEQQEAGVKYVSPQRDLSVAFAWFDIEQERRVVQGETPDGVRQVGAITDGWEIEIKKMWSQFELLVNYADMTAIEDSTGKRLSSIADKFGSVWGSYHFDNGVSLAFGARHTGTVTGANGTPEADAVTLYDARIGYTFGSWDFSLNGKNLSDKTYVSWCRSLNNDCGYGDQRSLIGDVRYHF